MDIFSVVRESCERTDCLLAPDRGGISNSAGSGSGWGCRTCKRKWSVWTPDNWHETVYDRDGNNVTPPAPPQTITEIKR